MTFQKKSNPSGTHKGSLYVLTSYPTRQTVTEVKTIPYMSCRTEHHRDLELGGLKDVVLQMARSQ